MKKLNILIIVLIIFFIGIIIYKGYYNIESVLISMIFSGFIVWIMISRHKGEGFKYGGAFEKQGSFKILGRRDSFSHRTVTSTPKPKKNN